MKLTKTVVTGAVLSLAFLANCDFLMGPSWTYSDVEMRAAIEGTWKLTRSNGETVTLDAKQATAAKQSARDQGFVKSAAACGTRSFVREAAACVDSTRMPLEIIVANHTIRDASFEVYGSTFKQGVLHFKIDDADLEAHVDPSGKVTEASLYRAGKPEKAITLQRIAKI